jgi:hypothetical protein
MTTDRDPGLSPDPRTKPRLILMGEFSSGKSTLTNILLGTATLPTQVTATRLPPVHISYGEPGAFAVTRAGARIAVDLADLAAITPEAVRALHLTLHADTLELCDLVDMPGISDPNMPTDTWDALATGRDHVIWCTHATQAWRQSEAAAWDRMRPATSGQNLLLITQFDKLRTPRDRARVLDRVTAETAGKFEAVFPVSLLDALAAGDNFDAWQNSGAHALMQQIVEIILQPPVPLEARPALDASLRQVLELATTSTQDRGELLTANFDPAARQQPDRIATRNEPRVTPRRVQVRPAAGERPRPQRPSSAETIAWPAEPGAL